MNESKLLRAVAIDDEPLALEVIKKFTEKVPFLNLESSFVNAFDAMQLLQTGQIDLIFLDIKMPGISGIEFVKALPSPPMVIFTTAYSEYAVQSFELDAVDYLLKPFSLSRFLKACNKAYEMQNMKKGTTVPQTQYVFIKCGYEKIKVNLHDIRYAESVGNYVQFVIQGRNIMSRLTMNEVEQLLVAPEFIRIHRSYIVAKSSITKIDKHSVWINEIELPIGAVYGNAIKELI